MRWFWIDRFVEFVHETRAVAEKAVTLGEEHLFDYFPGFPVMPVSLIIEGLAQTGGLLVGESHAFQRRIVLAKVGKSKFHAEVRPGDVLRYDVTIKDLGSDGAMIEGQATVAGHLRAEVELFFAYIDDRFPDVDLFDPADFLATLRLFGVYDVGCYPDGTPLRVPADLLAAEQQQHRDRSLADEP
ncbi:MAG: 3-hydroxyacyl-ACP dehydratase FabZ family protein [Planctomycetota bacterium]